MAAVERATNVAGSAASSAVASATLVGTHTAHARGVLFIACNVAMLLAFVVLDVRDLYYKTAWIGPYDSYAFNGIGDHVLNQVKLEPTHVHTTPGAVLERDSGWSSFLTVCEELHGAAPMFLSVMGANCRIGGTVTGVVVPKLVMTGTIRIDSVAWACCQLLFYHRRQGVCQERMVARFLKRYAMEVPSISRNSLATAGSPNEDALLDLLSVISCSSPIHRIVCIEGFIYDGPGLYNPKIFGCGSPNVYAASLAGSRAAYLSALLSDKAWLTLDEVNIMGLRFAVRQNDKSDYHVRVTHDNLSIASNHPLMNYSSSGHLYPLVLLSDIIVFVLNVGSTIEVFRLLLLPQLLFHLGYSRHRVAFFRDSTWLSLVSRAMYRSFPVAALIVFSHVITWQLVIPNAVIFSWMFKSSGRWQAILSSVRVGVLIVICFVWLWDVVVLVIRERAAYAVTRRTFVTVPELVLMCALVAYIRRNDMLSISIVKYARDHQRLTDSTSFIGLAGYSNAFDDDRDRLLSSDTQYWEMAVFELKKLHRSRSVHPSAPATTLAVIQSSSHDQRYHRLPVELLLDVLVRARSLLRFRLAMELPSPLRQQPSSSCRYLYAPLYFDFGTVIDTHGNMIARVGFLDAIPACIDLRTHIFVNDSVVLTGSTLAMQLARISSGTHKLAFTNAIASTLMVAARRTTFRFMGQTDGMSPVLPCTRWLPTSLRRTERDGPSAARRSTSRPLRDR